MISVSETMDAQETEKRKLKNLNKDLTAQIEQLQAELENSEEARSSLKEDLEEINSRVIDLEEQLYESKSI